MEKAKFSIEGRLRAHKPKGAHMKNIITLVVVVVVALVAFNYFSTGEFKQAYRQAGRSAGISGMDTTSDAEAALKTVDSVEREVKALRKRTDDPDAREKIDALLAEIKKYKEDVR